MSLLALAIAPALALFLLFYLRDKYEREPLGLLGLTFLAGCVVVFPVALIESWFFNRAGFSAFEENGFWGTLGAMLIGVALVEEFAKFSIIRFWVWKKKAFNEPYDGIMYTLMASLGFATVENIFYVLEYGEVVGWLRAFMTVPMHALTAVIMGYYIGLAKYPKDPYHYRHLLTGFVAAVFFHGFFNTFVSSREYILIAGAPLILVYVWSVGLRASKMHIQNSPFRKKRGSRG